MISEHADEVAGICSRRFPLEQNQFNLLSCLYIEICRRTGSLPITTLHSSTEPHGTTQSTLLNKESSNSNCTVTYCLVCIEKL